MNTVSTCLYNLYAKFTINTIHMSASGCSFYNNILGLPLLIGAALYLGEHQTVASSSLGTGSMIVVGLSGLVGTAISYAGFKVQALVSATSFTVVVNVSKIVSIIFGMLIFKKIPSFQAALGLIMSLSGALLYALSKNPPRTEQRKKD